MKPSKFAAILGALSFFVSSVFAQSVTPALQAKLDEQFKVIEAWAADADLVAAVKAHNTAKPAEYAAITQEKWRAMTVLDPLVRGLSKNSVGTFLKGKKSEVCVEAFVSDAAGTKVGFIAKTSNWSHKGKPKHDDPMAGKRWVGPIEVDESSGQQQIQIGVPVFEEGKPIGSLVVGLSISGLAK